MLQIADLYKSLYGQKPYSYLLEAYDHWKKGERKVSDQTMARILKCVPKFLSKEKRLFILKSEIIQFIDRQQKRFENRSISYYNIDGFYKDFGNAIGSFSKEDLRWFVKDVFTKVEIDTYVEISKYVVQKKLEQSYNQVKSDLHILYSEISKISLGIVSAYYAIDFFKAKVSLSNFPDIKMQLITKGISAPTLTHDMDEWMLSHLIDEILRLTYIQELGNINQEISRNDLGLLYNQYNELLLNDKEAHISSEFKGKGGVFSIGIQLKSRAKLKHYFVLSTSKAIASLSGFVLEIYLLFKFNSFKYSGGLNYLYIIIAILLIIQVFSEYNNAKTFRMEAIIYGRKQEQIKAN
ncbi:MAG: hypothetical protein HF312_02670 [Ignavibacteria bacterium]|nr:hypothetical protein [Ignavibacteria bacterium]MCU7519089.1 hypothetical protein [Ignavibacteria bacterium]